MSTCKHSGHLSVHWWGWISHEGAGIVHCIEGHLDSLQYQHILQNVIVPSVWMLNLNGITYLQQDHSSIYDSRVVQEWLSRQADVELIDWPPRSPDMNHVENMRSEVKRTMQEKWSVVPPRNSDELWCQTGGMNLLRLRVILDHWLSPWHDEWNQWSKQKCSGLLIKEVKFWKQPF